MTIQELFDELRKENDWSKEVTVDIDGNFVPIDRVIPNIMNEEFLILGIN